jgi:hypothetical protein
VNLTSLRRWIFGPTKDELRNVLRKERAATLAKLRADMIATIEQYERRKEELWLVNGLLRARRPEDAREDAERDDEGGGSGGGEGV